MRVVTRASHWTLFSFSSSVVEMLDLSGKTKVAYKLSIPGMAGLFTKYSRKLLHTVTCKVRLNESLDFSRCFPCILTITHLLKWGYWSWIRIKTYYFCASCEIQKAIFNSRRENTWVLLLPYFWVSNTESGISFFQLLSCLTEPLTSPLWRRG